MKSRPFLPLMISIWTISCVALSQTVSSPTEIHPTASNLGATQEATATPIVLTATPETTVIPTPSTGWFELVGHSSLLERGMNAALAIHGNYAYIGSRTDGRHADAGVLVLDISNPASAEIVYQIGPPEEGLVGQTSRELRVWPEQELLIVMNISCEAVLHDCGQPVTSPNINIYDISGSNAALPKLIATYPLGRESHEMFLWDDPVRDGRALLYFSTWGLSIDHLFVLDISQARNGLIQEIAAWTAPFGAVRSRLHSLSLSIDGSRAYLAYLRDGFMVLDTSQFADALPNPQPVLLTPPENWLRSPSGAHSAVKLFGKPYVMITEEVYGLCPWGWTYLIDMTDETRPYFVSEYKLPPYNTSDYCAATTFEQNRFTSFSSHNPTLTRNLAFITWHSGGLQAISIANPLQPAKVAEYIPAPLQFVRTEDPALSSGPDKVVMWSYPIIKDGLIYVVDIRNGLYILKYHGPFEEEVNGIHFLEGNSNLEDARRLEVP